VVIASRRAEGYAEKARQFGVCAPVRFIREPDIAVVGGKLTWLVSGNATKVGLCVALHDAAGPTGEGSAARVEAE
jgi:hypothetical protein